MHQPLAFVLLLVGGVLVACIVLFTSSSLFPCYVLDSIRRILRLSKREVKPNAQQKLSEAYRGIAKGVFSTGPEAFNHYLDVSQKATLKGKSEAHSLRGTVAALAFGVDAKKDHYPQGHSRSVSRIAAQIARQMGLRLGEIEDIRLGALLHDIGKAYVPDAILKKPSALTPEEFEVMKSHTVLGRQALHEPWASDYLRMRVRNSPVIQAAVRNHHEAFDGSGYPDGLKGENIPPGARIVAVANAFDSMVSEQVYRRGRSVEEAVVELRRCSGTQFDPNVVEAFVRSLEKSGSFDL